MYQEILNRYLERMPNFPSARRPRVGLVIREIRTNKGIRQMDFAKMVGMNESTFKSLENDHQKATTVDNLERCAKTLDIPTEELILIGREYDPANFFVYKREDIIPDIEGVRKRKHAPMDWHQGLRLRIRDFDITPISPPLNAKKDFSIFRLILAPKRTTGQFSLSTSTPVIGFVSEGFNIQIEYAGKPHAVTSHQAFALNGCHPHTIINDDADHAAIIYLVTKIPNLQKSEKSPGQDKRKLDVMDIATAVESIRAYGSPRPQHKLTLKHLADLTDFLHERQITELMRLKKGSSVVYWEKIEDLIGAVDIPMEEFLLWTRDLQARPFSLATANTRAWIEYPNHGLKIYSCVPTGVRNTFFCGQMFLEGAGQVGKESWERRDNAMVAFYVEEGELQIWAGKRKKTFHLSKGESAYLDGNLGYSLRNVSKTQTRLFFATYKAIQI